MNTTLVRDERTARLSEVPVWEYWSLIYTDYIEENGDPDVFYYNLTSLSKITREELISLFKKDYPTAKLFDWGEVVESEFDEF